MYQVLNCIYQRQVQTISWTEKMVLFRSYRNPINAAAVVTRPTTTTEEMKNIDLHGVAAVPVDWRQADSIHSY